MKNIFRYTILLMLIFLVTGCGKTTDKQINTSDEDEVPYKGGSVTIAVTYIDDYNPLKNLSSEMDDILKLVYEPLIKFDNNHKPIENIAQDIRFELNDYRITFNINQDIKWHDGDNISADDVIYSIEQIQNAKGSIYKECVENIAHIKKNDDTELSITYNKNIMKNIYDLYFPIVKKDNKSIGTGKYKFTEEKFNKYFVLKSNDNYYNGEPYIEKINVEVIEEDKQKLQAFKTGKIDFYDGEIDDYNKFLNDEDVEIYEYENNLYDFIGFNFENKLLNEKEIRKIIKSAVDKEKIKNEMYLNHAVVSSLPINPNNYLYEKEDFRILSEKRLIEKLDEIGASNLDEDDVFEYNINNKEYELEFEILVNEENDERIKIAKYLKDKLENIGFKINLKIESFEEFKKLILKDDFEIFIGGFEMPINPDLTNLLHSKAVEKDTNLFNYKNENLDILIKDIFYTLDYDENKVKFSKVNNKIREEIPMISLVFRKGIMLVNSGIKGEFKPLPYSKYDSLNKMYFTKKE